MEKYSLENLGNSLRRLRVKSKLSQAKTADKIGIDSRQYQRYESKNIPNLSVSMLFKILKYYKMTLEELLDQGEE